jgi:2-keto-myo-inositol isomerase
MNRRRILQSCAASTLGIGASSYLISKASKMMASEGDKVTLKYCLNMSTIQKCLLGGKELDVQDQIKVASKAGYSGGELWLRNIQKFFSGGGKLSDLRKQIHDSGLTVESAIAFGKWLVDDETTRKKGLEECARDMDTIRELGGTRIAAPPTGMTDQPSMDLDKAGERYRALLELGRKHGCVPQIEVWGFSKNCYSLKQVLYICAAAAHPDACILPDVYHLYKGGSDFNDLGMLAGSKVHVFHINDYPNDPSRSEIKDEHRVYPGDGVAPISSILQTMVANGFRGTLSLELFNRDYWKQDAQEVANTGLAKMMAAVQKAVG